MLDADEEPDAAWGPGSAVDLGEMSDREALAQLVLLGCDNGVFRELPFSMSETDQLVELANRVDAAFLARLAVCAKRRGLLKHAPLFVLVLLYERLSRIAQVEAGAYKSGDRKQAAILSAEVQRLSRLARRAFVEVVDGGKALRTLVGLLRTHIERPSVGTAPRTMIQRWLTERSPEDLFFSSVGSSPSMGDVIALAHPRPRDREQAAMFAYLLGRERGHFEGEPFEVLPNLPEVARHYESFRRKRVRRARSGPLLAAPYEMLEGLRLSKRQWVELAMRATWQQARQHLGTFARHGVFLSGEAIRVLADKLADPARIRRARATPGQLLAAYLHNPELPEPIRQALHAAAEIAVDNVPVPGGHLALLADPLGGGIRGYNGGLGGSRAVALVVATVLRKNPDALVIPLGTWNPLKLDAQASILSLAERLSSMPGPYWDAALSLKSMRASGFKPDLVWMLGGCWIDQVSAQRRDSATLRVWNRIVEGSPRARLVCLSGYGPGDEPVRRPDILTIGGFSDLVFDVVTAFVDDGTCGYSEERWARRVDGIDLGDGQEAPGAPVR